MKGNWQRSALAALLAILAIAGLTSWKATREPSYQGQTLTVWLGELRSGRTRRDAEEAIRQMGTNVIPVLFDRLRQEESGQSTQPGWSQGRSFGRWSNPFLPGLVSRALHALGPSILPQLISACTDPCLGIREAAVQALAFLGPDAASAIPTLVQSLHDPHGRLRMEAISTLSRMERFRVEAVPGLTALLDDASEPDFEKSELWRAAAVRLLGAIGPEANGAAPRLQTLWADENTEPLLRDEAASALWRIRGDPQAIAWFKTRLSESTEFGQSARALVALGNIGPAAKETVPLILEKARSYAVSRDPLAPNLAQLAQAALRKIDPAADKELGQDQFQVLDLKSMELTNAPASPAGGGGFSGARSGRPWGLRPRRPVPQP